MPLSGKTGMADSQSAKAVYSSIFPDILSTVATHFFFFIITQSSKASKASKACRKLLDRLPEHTKNKLDNSKFRLMGRANRLNYLAWQAG